MAENIHNQFNNNEINNPLFLSGGLPHRPSHLLVAAGAGVPENFLGREQELKEIRNMLTTRQNTLALVNAEGGMGKTTLAAKYWKTYGDEYQHIAWLFCENGILAALRDQLSQPLGLVETLKGYSDDFEQQVQIIKTTMANLPKDCLLLLDNANNPDHIKGFIKMMSGLDWHVLITSRCSKVLPDAIAEYSISSLPPEQAKDLFWRNYNKSIQQFDETLLDRFLIAVGYNTLCIEVFSKNLYEAEAWGYTFEKFVKHLEEKGLFLGEDSFEIQTDYAGQTTDKTSSNSDRIIQTMYDMAGLNDSEIDILATFALLPAENHSPTILRKLLAFDSSADLKRSLDALAQKGWISTNTSTYRISPVIQKIVKYSHADRLWTLGESLAESFNNIFELEKALFFFEERCRLGEELCRIDPQNVSFKNGLAISFAKTGEIHMSIGNLDRALNFFDQYNILEKELNDRYPQNISFKNGLSISYEKLGDTHSALGNLDRALTYFEDETRLFEEIYEAYPQNVEFKNGMAISYSKLGETHTTLGNMDRALTYFEQSNELFEGLYEAYPQNVEFKKGFAISYEKLGETHSALGNQDLSLTYFEDETRLFEELYETHPQNVEFKNGLAISYQKLGVKHRDLENLDRALIYFEQLNHLFKELHEAYPQNVSFKNGLAISHVKLGEISRDHLSDSLRAKALFEQAEVLWQELVLDAPQYAQFQKFLALVQRDLAALE